MSEPQDLRLKDPTENDFLLVINRSTSNAYRTRQWKLGLATAVFSTCTVTLIALTSIKDFGLAYNAIITGSLGLCLQSTLQCLPFRYHNNYDGLTPTFLSQAIKFEKDLLVKYAATFFIVMTQIYLNTPQTQWYTRLVNGTFNAILGMQIATKIDNILQWRFKNARRAHANISEYSGDEQLSNIELIRQSNQATIPILFGNRPRSRYMAEAIKVGAAIIGIVSGYVFKTEVPLRFGSLILGHSIGCAFQETVHGIKHHLQKKHPLQPSRFGQPTAAIPPAIKFLELVEKLERLAGVFLPGLIIAFNTMPTTILAGVCMGMLRQIDWIRFTNTPISQLEELRETNQLSFPQWLTTTASVAKWAFAIFAVGGFLAYGFYEGIAQGPVVNAYVLGTVALVLYSSYCLTRLIDRYFCINSNDRDKAAVDQLTVPHHRFYNTLFFYTQFSIAAPIIYIAVTQVMQIGDYALNKYLGYQIAVASLGYASLAWAFGTQAGHRATNKNVPYPAEIDPLIMLYTVYFIQQVMGEG